MKKKRLVSLAAAFMMIFTLLTLVPVAALDASAQDYTFNYCDIQDNKEAPYDGSYWIQPPKWNAEPIDPSEYTGDAKIWFDKVEVKSTEARGKVQRIQCYVSGAERKVNTVSLHILYDTRLTPIMKIDRYVNLGDALCAFASVDGNFEPGVLELVATNNINYLFDGTMFYVDFKLPDDARPGDVYPIGIRYENHDVTYDLFYNSEQDYEGRLTMAHIFTNGIENGYISVEDNNLIVFDAGGGSGSMDPVSQSKDSTTFTLPECEFIPPEGKEFQCWEYADGSRAGSEGETVLLGSNLTTLRARWKNAKIKRADITVNGPVPEKRPYPKIGISPESVVQSGDVVWLDGDRVLSAEDIFEEGRRYTVSIPIETAEGFRFADGYQVYINGILAETTSEPMTYCAELTAEKSIYSFGDVNGDGDTDIEDAVLVIAHINGMKALDFEQYCRGDANDSGELDIEDAVMILCEINGVSTAE